MDDIVDTLGYDDHGQVIVYTFEIIGNPFVLCPYLRLIGYCLILIIRAR